MQNPTLDTATKKEIAIAPVVWVTGSGAPRVGQAIARHFAANGYRIVLHANHSVQSAQQLRDELTLNGTQAMIVRGSLEDSDFAAKAVQEIVRTFGRIDVLINAAAIWDWKSLEETTASDVQKQFAVNTLGSFLCCQAAGLQMVQQSTGGALVLLGDCAVERPYRDFSAYFVGKGAIETMTKSLAVEFASRNPNIRVNAIMPGPVMLDPSISEERANASLQQCLLKRLGRPEDVAQAAFFLSTQTFITGVCLNVDGGRSIFSHNDALVHPTYHLS